MAHYPLHDSRMLRHIGIKRTFRHNLHIAAFLSFVAGGINVLGFIMIGTFTTNVTGHFALFSNEIVDVNLIKAFTYFMYVFSFFSGSFSAAVMVEVILKNNTSNRLIFPLITQSFLLCVISYYTLNSANPSADIIACVLLFSMGMQNSLVTIVSNSIVRTTHLTGLFTDLGIELAQMFFHKRKLQQVKLQASVRLRFNIILFFFIGGVLFGVIYNYIGSYSLYISASILILTIVVDVISLKIRKLQQK